MKNYSATDYAQAIFVGNINGLRKANKGKWVFEQGTIGGLEYSYKAYNTYIQRLTVGGVTFDSPCDCSVKIFLESLRKAFAYAISQANQTQAA